LLNAVRDRGARDAVRSVIERLTGSPAGGNPPVGAAIPAAEQAPATAKQE
jgi:prolyl-tRNA editing enzyme YbaK/EbsC (Cys-tRNA(Pro) deacylase)